MKKIDLFGEQNISMSGRSDKAWGYHRGETTEDEWLTPLSLIKALGEFDLDPCAPINRPWDVAKNHYTIKENGLIKKWHGRVFCNPPYGSETHKWLHKCAMHDDCIALTFSRTETKMFFDYVWEADAVFFLKGRLTFYDAHGNKGKWTGGAGSVLIAWGIENVLALKKLKDHTEYKGKLCVNGLD